jgi:hypothetical protein
MPRKKQTEAEFKRAMEEAAKNPPRAPAKREMRQDQAKLKSLRNVPCHCPNCRTY